jgi:hypothetical protein
MDPRRSSEPLLALGAPGGAAVRLPARGSFPSLDDHLVPPETREERIRGRRVEAMPAHPPHADRQFELSHTPPATGAGAEGIPARARRQANAAPVRYSCTNGAPRRGDLPGRGSGRSR